MTAADVILKVRFYLNDQDTATLRWLDDELWPLVNDAVSQVTRLRPDALYDANGALITVVPAISAGSMLSIDDKWIVPVALFTSAQAMNKQAGQTFNAKKVESFMQQFSLLIKV